MTINYFRKTDIVAATIFFLLLACFSAAAQEPPELVAQIGHADQIKTLAFSPDGELLASGAEDNTVKIWGLTLGRELRTLSGHEDSVERVVFSSDSKKLAGASRDTIVVWNVITGERIATFQTSNELVDSISLTERPETLVAKTSGKTTDGSWTKRIRRWDLQTKRQLPVRLNESDEEADNSVSPDGLVEVGSYEAGPIQVRQIRTQQEICTFDLPGATARSIAFSAPGRLVAVEQSGRKDDRTIDKIGVCNLVTGRVSYVYEPPPFSSVGSLAFSSDGKELAIGWWDITHWTSEILLVKVGSNESPRHLVALSHRISTIAVSNDGKTVVTGGEGKRVSFWNASTGLVRTALKAHPVSVESLAVSPDGKTVISTGGGQLKCWYIDTVSECTTKIKDLPRDVEWAGLSPNGEILATQDAEYFDKDGNKVFTPNGTGEVHRLKLWSMATGALLATPYVSTRAFPTGISFSGDSTRIAVAGIAGNVKPNNDYEPFIAIWDIQGRRQTHILHRAESIDCLAFSHDGKHVAVGGLGNEKIIQIWDLEDPSRPRKFANAGPLTSLVFNRDDTSLLSAGWDNTVKLWDVKSGTIRLTFKHHSPLATAVFSHDERIILAGGDDKVVTLWDANDGTKLASVITMGANDFNVESRTDWLVATPEGLFDGSPGAWEQILWRFQNNTRDVSPVEIGFNRFFYPGLLGEILSGKRPRPTQTILQVDRRQPLLKLRLTNELSSPITKRNVELQIEIAQAPAGAQDVRLFRNGMLVNVWHGDVLKGKENGVLKKTVPIVAGKNDFIAYAFNRDNVKSLDARLELTGDGGLKTIGTFYVFSIGINQYKADGYNLKFAVDDVDELATKLKEHQEPLRQYAAETISLTNALATRDNIMLVLHRFAEGPEVKAPPDVDPEFNRQLEKVKQLQPEDALLIYFSGHAMAVNGRLFLLPHDFVAGAKQPRDARTISDVELNDALEPLNPGKLLMVLDACHTGQALGGEKEGYAPTNSKGLAQLAYDKGMYILTAAQSYQAALELSRTQSGMRIEHGLLTYSLLEGFANAHPDTGGMISEREWMNYAVEQVPLLQVEDRHAAGGAEVSQSKRGTKLVDDDKDTIQLPRVFYRRELELQPLIIANRSTEIQKP